MCSTQVAVASPAEIPLSTLERQICELAAHIAAATCHWLLLVAAWDERRGWAEWGVKSCAHWLSWRCSIGLGAAREQVRVGRRLRELPLLREAFSSGELSYCKVRALTRIATPEIEASLVTIGRHATGAQLEKLVRGYVRARDATLETAQLAYERRDLLLDWQPDGSLRLEARLTAEDGALLAAALQAAEEWPPYGPSAPEICEETPVGGTIGERRADALMSLARAALAARQSERPSGDPCHLVVHVDVETLAGDEVRSCSEAEGGPTLAPETVRRLGCDAAVSRIIERDGRPLSLGRRTRTISPALRRALRSRDDGCRFPGCTHRRFLHAHHIQHWARGGPTKLDNLVQLCSYHHRLVHEGGFGVECTGSGSVRFRRPDGRLIRRAMPCGPARGAGLERQNQARGVVVDDRTCMAKSAGERLDYGLATELLLARALAAA